MSIIALKTCFRLGQDWRSADFIFNPPCIFAFNRRHISVCGWCTCFFSSNSNLLRIKAFSKSASYNSLVIYRQRRKTDEKEHSLDTYSWYCQTWTVGNAVISGKDNTLLLHTALSEPSTADLWTALLTAGCNVASWRAHQLSRGHYLLYGSPAQTFVMRLLSLTCSSLCFHCCHPSVGILWSPDAGLRSSLAIPDSVTHGGGA